MSGWQLSPTPPAALIARTEQRPAFFASAAFAAALRALGAECLYAWHPERQVGFLVPIFSRLRWLRVGFLGFPVCPEATAAATLVADLLSARHCQVLRIVLPRLREAPPQHDALRPNVWIEGLRTWSPSSKLRRDLAYAERRIAGWQLARDRLDGAAAAALYFGVIARHRGRAVYGRGYFERLAAACGNAPGLSCYAMEDEAGKMRAFAVLAVHEDTGYYLHAAADEEARRRGAGDLLLRAVVEEARRLGCQRLDLMASPPAQPGLLAFKRKWGNQVGVCATLHASRGLVGRAMRFILAWRLRDRDRQR
jgi:ribosomal protein S18 acetylase RimI-like enzyme